MPRDETKVFDNVQSIKSGKSEKSANCEFSQGILLKRTQKICKKVEGENVAYLKEEDKRGKNMETFLEVKD